MGDKEKTKTSSKKAKSQAARLMAVQAIHQNMLNKKPVSKLIDEYLSKRVGMIVDGKEMVEPDGTLFKSIIEGVARRYSDLDVIIIANLKKGENDEPKVVENLLKAILLAASFEILEHGHIDSPVIINDYLNVTHCFYSKGEVSLVNAVLDAISSSIRT